MTKRFAALICALLLAGATHAAGPEEGGFWIELEGQVRTEVVDGKEVIRVVPAEGLPVRVDGGVAVDWRRWEGSWVEVDGKVGFDGIEPAMQVWEFSLEDDQHRRSRTAVETEGFLISGATGPVLRTDNGDAPLAGYNGSFPAGVRLEVKGSLVVENGRLALRVLRAKPD